MDTSTYSTLVRGFSIVMSTGDRLSSVVPASSSGVSQACLKMGQSSSHTLRLIDCRSPFGPTFMESAYACMSFGVMLTMGLLPSAGMR